MIQGKPRWTSGRARLRVGAAGAVLLGVASCALFQPSDPTPDEILARIDPPPSAVLSPAEALTRFRLAPGFRIELVAAEPLIEDPVAIEWDDAGRIFAVEMRGYMPDIEGRGEDAANGRIVVLEDTDADGRMDKRRIYLDGLVLPRAIAVLPEGVLVGEPPNLWLCKDTTPDDATPHCDEKTRIGDYGVDGMNPEHNENGLLRGVNGRIYNARSNRSFVFERERPGSVVLQTERAVFRGQWGLDQDEDGTFFYNTNSTALLADRFDTSALLRHPVTDPAWARPGASESLLSSATIHSIRVNPGLNRAYSRGELRADGRLHVATAISGLALYRGDQFGDGFASELGQGARRHVFVPEPGANVVLHAQVEREVNGTSLRAKTQRYADEVWGERDFVASLDERFRPVDAQVGPDGALYLVDMYRGVIQHSTYVSEYLANYVAAQGLSEPLGLGRIWRVVREEAAGGTPLRPGAVLDASRASTEERLAALSHPNAWQRSRAAQWLVHDWRGDSGEGLRRVANHATSASARVRALWALAQRRELDVATWLVALGDQESSVRIAALRAGAERLQGRTRAAEHDALAAALADPDAGVALQAVLSSNFASSSQLQLVREHVFPRWDDALLRQAFLASSAGYELSGLVPLGGSMDPTPEGTALRGAILSDLTRAAFSRLSATAPQDTEGLLDSIAASRQDEDVAVAMLQGLADAALAPSFKPTELAGPHALIDNAALQPGHPLAEELTRARRAVTWPGDDFIPGLPVLTPDQVTQVEAGGALYGNTCAACHGPVGAGLPSVAPSLAGTAYVNDADDWFVRIALHGLRGPVTVRGEYFDAVMPGHGSDARFNDASIANLLSFVRRSWGNSGRWIHEGTVSRIRAETAKRIAPWTVEELDELDVEHALDRFVGKYSIEGVPIRFTISRSGVGLELSSFGMGASELERVDRRNFRTETADRKLAIEFLADEQGEIYALLLNFGGGQRITAQRND